MFNSIYLKALKHPEFLQYVKFLLEKTDKAGAETLKIKGPRDLLAAVFILLQKALNQENVKDETKKIKQLDDDRDSYYVGFSFLVEGYLRGKNDLKKNAAITIRGLLKSQGPNVVRQNYQIESAILSNVVKALTTEPKYIAAVETLGLQSWVADIDEANKAFETAFMSRNTSISESENVPAFGEVRLEAMPLIERLLNLISSRLETAKEDKQPTEPYEKLVAEINTLIDSFVPYTLPKSKDKADDKPSPPSA